MSNGIVFEVDTTRILKILASEIYDSPLALLRENVQNAYDAIRQRFVPEGKPLGEGRIDIVIIPSRVSIADNGVGMTESVLRANFWKAGSSGKRSDAARAAGVVGTFGIGAMANFGVCTRLTILTRAVGTSGTLESVADRSTLSIAKECITLTQAESGRDFGTTVSADLDADSSIGVDAARIYLEPYVAILPVAVYLNGKLISQRLVEERLAISKRGFAVAGIRAFQQGGVVGTVTVSADPNGLILATVTGISLDNVSADGQMTLVQDGGTLFGLRSSFGLAPVPVNSLYSFGGIADLGFLHPTAGREAVSRESIEQVGRIITQVERAVSEIVANTDVADKNNAFMQYVSNTRKVELAHRISIHLWPDDKDVPLGDVTRFIGARSALQYSGRDQEIIKTFANESAALLQIAQASPRRQVQTMYVTEKLRIPAVPTTAQIIKEFKSTDLTAAEASLLIRLTSILRDDYLIPDVEVRLAQLSHGVTILPRKEGDLLVVCISRTSTALPPLLELYKTDWQLFPAFMKDFARTAVYPRVQQYVPSSTRQGADALKRMLERNKEIYRYESEEYGVIDNLLGDFLSGESTLTEVLRTARANYRIQNLSVSAEQVGTIEGEIPDVAKTPAEIVVQHSDAEYAPSPPIVRDEITSNMKVLTTATPYPLLNGFTMLLGLSDRVVRGYGEFFRWPHTTRVIWGGHRVVYIFTDTISKNSLYYDIELKTPLDAAKASGRVLPTTTLITKYRVFVPVPDELKPAFAITEGPKEFYVRFDTLTGTE
jgi:molecular chaperone HtpG